MGLEVERKFVLEGPPPWLEERAAVPIEQGYLALDEGLEVRLRRAGDERLLTVKRGAGEVREEIEIALGAEQFEALWPLTEGRRLTKTRYRAPVGDGLEAEVDVYADRLAGLVVAEIEFPSPERSHAFRPPSWLADEVTGDRRYANRNLALDGDGLAAGTVEPRRSGKEREVADRNGPSRSYKLKRGEGAAEGIRRVARGRADKALEALRGIESDPAEAIHSARKDLKNLRAVLRLCREELGERLFRRENHRYRDAGRLLSRSRDAEVKLETLQALQDRFGAEMPGGVYGPWALALEGERDEVVGAGDGRPPEVERAIEAIEAAGATIPDWPLEKESWGAIGPGLTRAYREGRRALRRTATEPSAESVHEWRKRAKDLTYQLRLLRGAWPELLDDAEEQSHRLTDLLGDHHDLALLAADLDSRELGSREELAELIERRQAELLDEALALGRRVYAEKPKAFERRMRAYWRAWRVSRSTSPG